MRNLACIVLALLLAVSPAAATSFVAVDGFEDDVDVVVAPNKEFLVVPVEAQGGAAASIKIFDLDAVNGNLIGLATTVAVAGWENGVDPIVVNVAGTMVLFAPIESENGASAEARLATVNANGTLGVSVTIGLGNLGFEDDVDAIPVTYMNTGIVVPLETEDGSAAGILAVKTNVADFGACTVVASDVRNTGCASDVQDASGRLKGFVDGVDGIFVRDAPATARVALPTHGVGTTAVAYDLVIYDFDYTVAGPPAWMAPSQSVKDRNAGGARPLPFPGYERDVDLALLPVSCVGSGNKILVPVEDRVADRGDLYVVDATPGAGSGLALWRYDLDNPAAVPRILGYEEGVDIVLMCDLAIVPDDLLAVPVENETGSEADLLLVEAPGGDFYRSVEVQNAGFRLIGYEKGVEPLRWSATSLAVAVDDERGRANLLAVNTAGTITDAVEDRFTNPSNVVQGFERGVDAVVAPLGDPDRTLFVPVERQSQGDANLLIFPGPPGGFLGGESFEAENPGIVVSGLERDVDATLVEKENGYETLYVPEEQPTSGGLARMRFHTIPTGPGPLLALPAERAVGAPAPNLFFVRGDATLVQQNPDAYGFETGLDPVANVGDTGAPDPPAATAPALGLTADGDNTITMENSVPGNADGDALGDGVDCAPLDSGVWSVPVEVSELQEDEDGGEAVISWKSQDGTAGPDTVYDVASGVLSELRADAGYDRVACFADELRDTPTRDARAAVAGDGFYHLVRAQNACGVGPWGAAELDAVSPCP